MPKNKPTIRRRRAAMAQKPRSSQYSAKTTAKAQTERTETERIADARAKLAAELHVAGLKDHERAYLATCQKVFRSEAGSNTPLQNLLVSVMYTIGYSHWPTPDELKERVNEFEREWTAMKTEVATFCEMYPEAAPWWRYEGPADVQLVGTAIRLLNDALHHC